MKEYLKKLFAGQDLTRRESQEAMDLLMAGETPPEHVGAFLGVLKGKGESIQEIAGLVESMRNHALKLPIQRQDLIDTCGTGGDGAHTFNISTVNSFIVAAAGLGVVKHGNRSISSKCGSADVLEELGVPIDLTPEECAQSVDDIGFGFLFARTLHPSVKNVAPIRSSLGVRTVFNLLGPLTNPAGAKRQLIGIYDPSLLEQLAHVLRELGSEEVMLVHGDDGLDEVTLTAETSVAHLKNGQIRTYKIDPKALGFQLCHTDDLVGGDAAQNGQILEGILGGNITGPMRDIVVLNAGCALMVGGKADDIPSGIELANSLIDEGKALDRLNQARAFKK